jgi:hypothetical protein
MKRRKILNMARTGALELAMIEPISFAAGYRICMAGSQVGTFCLGGATPRHFGSLRSAVAEVRALGFSRFLVGEVGAEEPEAVAGRFVLFEG